MDALADAGIIKVHIVARASKNEARKDAVWTIIPANGETITKKRVEKNGKIWDFHEHERPSETIKMEAG